MKVAFACDHGGFPLRDAVTERIKALGHEVLDFGVFDDKSVDYPDFASKAARAVQQGRAARAVIICGSGVGACVTANKYKGVRASVAHDLYSAAQGVEHDNMNALCLGGRIVNAEQARALVKVFLEASFNTKEPRYSRRLGKVSAIEDSNFK